MILGSASTSFRRSGINGVSIADLMGTAGLTHGGFYMHFKSREDLVSESVTSAMNETNDRFRALMRDAPPGGGLETIAGSYLTHRHRDEPEMGCPLPALGADIGRASPATRGKFSRELAAMVGIVAQQYQGLTRSVARQRAMAAIATMVGSVMLARATNDTRLSDRILVAGKRAVLGAASAQTNPKD
jgi:TetR/AcrR family transcriptional regulator, transcriptional repressor for nem operon